MILFRELRLSRMSSLLIDRASFQIHPGWRVGLTGANGTGKSTLFALLQNEIQQDAGDIEIPGSWVIAHVAQEMPALSCSALDYVLDGDAELREIQQKITLAEQQHAGELIGELYARLTEIDGYSASARASALLAGLGFTDQDFQRPIKEFSGGWRMRLNLAQALMCRSDLLLLDEPTNHLDLDAVIWLEQWLCGYRGTLLVISHDRDFLDVCTNHILHIEHQKIRLYNGNYSQFEQQRGEHLAQQQSMYERQQREVAHIENYIRRFRAKATKARQAQSRIKALERMERIAPAHVDTPFTFEFLSSPPASDPLLKIEQAVFAYTADPLLKDIQLSLRPDDRIGLLGRNGTGKSTLIKVLASQLTLTQGELVCARNLSVGYFAQHQLEALREDESPLQHLQRLAPAAREQDLRNYLGRFGFGGETSSSTSAVTLCGTFSGGEKARLALALLIWQRPNLLLLDEPTNHLDLEMRHALTLALQTFDGAMILVSHDRALLRACCDRFLLVDRGSVTPFDGDLDDYRIWLNEQRHDRENPADNVRTPLLSKRKEEEGLRQQLQKQRQSLSREHEKLESRLKALDSEKVLLDQRLSDPALYENDQAALLQTLLNRHKELVTGMEQAETRWFEIEQQLHSLSTI